MSDSCPARLSRPSSIPETEEISRQARPIIEAALSSEVRP